MNWSLCQWSAGKPGLQVQPGWGHPGDTEGLGMLAESGSGTFEFGAVKSRVITRNQRGLLEN